MFLPEKKFDNCIRNIELVFKTSDTCLVMAPFSDRKNATSLFMALRSVWMSDSCVFLKYEL